MLRPPGFPCLSATKAFFRLDGVATDGHDVHSRAIETELGRHVRHRKSRARAGSPLHQKSMSTGPPWRSTSMKQPERDVRWTRLCRSPNAKTYPTGAAPESLRWTPKTGQAAKREVSLGAAGWPEVGLVEYPEEAQS